MDAYLNKSFNQLEKNDLIRHQVILSFISNQVLLLHNLYLCCLTDSQS